MQAVQKVCRLKPFRGWRPAPPQTVLKRRCLIFAGSGGIGIEALSRGADFCAFIEKNRRAAAVIEENLKFTRLASKAQVYSQDVFGVLSSLQEAEPFDCIFMDPPYDRELEKQVLEQLRGAACVDENTRIIVEASLSTKFDYLEDFSRKK